MGDWANPTVNSQYDDVIDELKARDVDVATLFASGTETGIPTNSIRWNTAASKLQRWNGTTWVDLVLSLAGGGTAAASASAARTSLGLGSMATQESNNVSITGGAISGITMAASVITSGQVALARGGTGASLALGAIGTVLKSDGAGVVFGNGSDIAGLNASNLASGTVPLARLSGITVSQMASANVSQFTNDAGYISGAGGLNASNLTSGTVPLARLSGITSSQMASAAVSQWSNDSGYVTSSIINSLNASNLTSGTLPDARLSGTYTNNLIWNGTQVWNGNVAISASCDVYSAAGINIASGSKLSFAVSTDLKINGTGAGSATGGSMSVLPPVYWIPITWNGATVLIPGYNP
jgi:hypothetical protein